MMFSAVVARGTAARRSVWNAADIVGIIVAPIPRPMTKSVAPIAQ
jgi:hypothetical protein